MNDILPELLNAVEEAYHVNIKQDEAVKRLLNELKNGTADYEKASDYAEHLGDALAKAFQTQISADTLPDGRMYYNIANRLVNATFQDNYSRIASYCKGTQESLNKAAGIGLKAQVPEFNQDRADGIIERLSEAENYDDVRWILGEPVTNFSMAIVDDYIKANADFQYKAGLSPKIVRTTNGKCCAWCDRLAGTYDYKDVKKTGNDVFRRHRHCRCKVIYDPADGKKVKDVWTKKEEDRSLAHDSDKIEKRVKFSGEKPRTIKKEPIFTKKFKRGSGKNYPIRFVGSDHVAFAGDKVEKVTVIAGENVKSSVRQAGRLQETYNQPSKRWEKVSGVADIMYKGEVLHTEIHWFEANGVREEVKVKRVIKDGVHKKES